MSYDIAFDMDEYFRQQDPQYAAEHPEAHEAKEDIYENLMVGRIAAFEEKLAALGQTRDDYLPSELEKYKEASGYEAALDTSMADAQGQLLCDRHEPGADRGGRVRPAPSIGRWEVSHYGKWYTGLCCACGAAGKDNPLRTAEMTLEDDYGMIDGVINNGRRYEEGLAVQVSLRGICATFAKYFASGHADPQKDMLMLSSCTLMLTDDEFGNFLAEINDLAIDKANCI